MEEGKKYFLSFSTEYWKNGRREEENFEKTWQNSGNVGRMEEVVKEGNKFKS